MFPGNQTGISVFKNRIERKGLYDVNAIYKRIKDWFGEANYTFTESENTTNEKAKGTEIKLTLKGERFVDDYVRYNIELKFLIIETEKVKVENKTLDRGTFSVFMTTTMDIDYRNRWSKTKFSKFLRFMYNNYLIKYKILNVYIANIKFESDDLFNGIKEVMEMYNA